MKSTFCINPNDPAYPIVETKDASSLSLGITKREYFARIAPEEIPNWFVHVALPVVKKPKGWSDYPEDFPFRQEMKAWQHDPCYDLPEELADFQKSWEDYGTECAEHRKMENETRYFQWRVYYANQLIAELNKSTE